MRTLFWRCYIWFLVFVEYLREEKRRENSLLMIWYEVWEWNESPVTWEVLMIYIGACIHTSTYIQQPSPPHPYPWSIILLPLSPSSTLKSCQCTTYILPYILATKKAQHMTSHHTMRFRWSPIAKTKKNTHPSNLANPFHLIIQALLDDERYYLPFQANVHLDIHPRPSQPESSDDPAIPPPRITLQDPSRKNRKNRKGRKKKTTSHPPKLTKLTNLIKSQTSNLASQPHPSITFHHPNGHTTPFLKRKE